MKPPLNGQDYRQNWRFDSAKSRKTSILLCIVLYAISTYTIHQIENITLNEVSGCVTRKQKAEIRLFLASPLLWQVATHMVERGRSNQKGQKPARSRSEHREAGSELFHHIIVSAGVDVLRVLSKRQALSVASVL